MTSNKTKPCACTTCQFNRHLDAIDAIKDRANSPGIVDIMTADQWERMSRLRERDVNIRRACAAGAAVDAFEKFLGRVPPKETPERVAEVAALRRDSEALVSECEATYRANKEEADRRRDKMIRVRGFARQVLARIDTAGDERHKWTAEFADVDADAGMRDVNSPLSQSSIKVRDMRLWEEAAVDWWERELTAFAAVLSSFGY